MNYLSDGLDGPPLRVRPGVRSGRGFKKCEWEMGLGCGMSGGYERDGMGRCERVVNTGGDGRG